MEFSDFWLTWIAILLGRMGTRLCSVLACLLLVYLIYKSAPRAVRLVGSYLVGLSVSVLPFFMDCTRGLFWLMWSCVVMGGGTKCWFHFVIPTIPMVLHFLHIVSPIALPLLPSCVLNAMTYWITGEMSIEYYATSPLTRIVPSRHKHNTCICTKEGVNLWSGFIKCLLKSYDNHKSWAGEFELNDLRVYGTESRIETTPLYEAHFANLLLDLSKMAKLLSDLYMTNIQNPGQLPLNVKQLIALMTKPPVSVDSPEQEKKEYLKYLCNNPAVKLTGRRKALTRSILNLRQAGAGHNAPADALTTWLSVLMDSTGWALGGLWVAGLLGLVDGLSVPCLVLAYPFLLHQIYKSAAVWTVRTAGQSDTFKWLAYLITEMGVLMDNNERLGGILFVCSSIGAMAVKLVVFCLAWLAIPFGRVDTVLCSVLPSPVLVYLIYKSAPTFIKIAGRGIQIAGGYFIGLTVSLTGGPIFLHSSRLAFCLMYVNHLIDGGARWWILFFPLVHFLYLVSALAPKVEWLMVLLLPTELLNVMSYLVTGEMSVQGYSRRPLTKKVRLQHNSFDLLILSKEGVELWLGFMNCIVTSYYNQRSWGGTFHLKHMRVRGSEFKIQLTPVYKATFKNLLLDLSRLATLLSGFYRPSIENPDQLPLYLKHLIAVMTRPRVHSASSEQQKRRFLKFLLNHPALKSAGRRKALMREIQEAIAGMDDVEYERVMQSVSSIRMTKRSWRREPRKVLLMRKVLYFRQGGKSHTKLGYDATAAQLLRFIRNFYAHTGGSTFLAGQHFMIGLLEAELALSHMFSDFMAEAIYGLVMDTGMHGQLEGAWEPYAN